MKYNRQSTKASNCSGDIHNKQMKEGCIANTIICAKFKDASICTWKQKIDIEQLLKPQPL